MKKTVLVMSAAAVVLCGALAYGVVGARSSRTDCPGTILCPLTGETICRDQCPLPARSDGPAACPACEGAGVVR